MSHPTNDRIEDIDEYRTRRAVERQAPNPKQAYGDRKIPLHLVPWAAMIATAEGLGEGAPKYGAFNWRGTKVEAMTYIGAALRHIAAWVDGEDVDPDSKTGKRHLSGALASLAILVDAIDGDFVIDNRPPPGPAPRLLLEKVKHE